MIMDALSDTVTPIPDVGTLCTFVYNAKTPNLRYDQHPLVLQSQIYLLGDSVEQTFIIERQDNIHGKRM